MCEIIEIGKAHSSTHRHRSIVVGQWSVAGRVWTSRGQLINGLYSGRWLMTTSQELRVQRHVPGKYRCDFNKYIIIISSFFSLVTSIYIYIYKSVRVNVKIWWDPGTGENANCTLTHKRTLKRKNNNQSLVLMKWRDNERSRWWLVYTVYTVYTVYIHSVHCVYIQCTYSVHTVYTQCTYSVYTKCELCQLKG